MLTTYFKSSRLLERYRFEFASPYLDDFIRAYPVNSQTY